MTWEQRALSGDPRFEPSRSLPPFPCADYARLLGLDALRVASPDEVGPAWERALAADRPRLLQMVTDPNVPPSPPHVGIEQMKNPALALLKGDPQARRIAVASAKEWWASLAPDPAD